MIGLLCHLQVHDSHNIHFATKAWKLAATDLNQGKSPTKTYYKSPLCKGETLI